MKKKWTSLLILVFLFFSYSIKAQNTKRLFVEFIVPDEKKSLIKITNKFEIPPKHDFQKELIGGGFATVDCIHCRLTASYEVWVFMAEKISDEKLKLGISAKFGNQKNCNVQKEFIIDLENPKVVNLKCGVKARVILEEAKQKKDSLN